METFLNAESTMIILFAIVALGFMARKIGYLDDHSDAALSKLVTNITCPAMIIGSVLLNDDLPDASVILNILLVSVVTFIPILVLAWLEPRLLRAPREAYGSHSFAIAFGNTGFIGFAVIGAIVGANAVLYASIYNLVFNLVIFSFGAYFVQSSGGVQLSWSSRLRKMGRSLVGPAMISCLAALVLALLGVTDMDGVIGRGCDMLGSMTPPASMLVIGSTLAKYDFREMLGNWRVYPTALLRLLGVPAIVWFVGGLMTPDAFLVGTLALESGMPVAALGPIFCLTYGGDLRTMSQALFVTTVLSIVSIPLIALTVL